VALSQKRTRLHFSNGHSIAYFLKSQEHTMNKNDAIVAVFSGHQDAETAVRKLADAGLDIKHFSIVGKGYHTDERVVGFYNTGDRIKFWGKNGAMWGGLWGLFFGGIFMTIPLIGPVIVLGHLSAMAFAAVEGAILVGGLSALGAAMYSLGIPKDSVIAYEEAVKVDNFLLVAHGPVAEMTQAQGILKTLNPIRLDLHQDVKDMPEPPVEHASLPMRLDHNAHSAHTGHDARAQ